MKKLIVAVLVMLPSLCWSECAEYRIIDRGDSMEAVCIGGPDEPVKYNSTPELDKKPRVIIQKQPAYVPPEGKTFAQYEAERLAEELNMHRLRVELEREQRAASDQKAESERINAEHERVRVEAKESQKSQIFKNLDGTPARKKFFNR